MSAFKPYERYKASGVEWLGDVPEHWEVKQTRHVFSFSKGLTITKENLQDEGIPCISYGEVHSKYGFEVVPEKHLLKCVDETYLKTDPNSLLNYGDFIFADTSEDIKGSGNFSYLNSNSKTFAGYHTIIARLKFDFNSRFLAYLFDSGEYRTQVQKTIKGVKVFSITQSLLKATFVWLPPLSEQTAITQFLDQKTAQIDALIAKKQQLLNKLAEQRTALISHAVTKGLNPNAPLKASGVEWLGDVPEHWEVKKAKYFLSYIGSGKTPKGGAEVYVKEGIMILRSQNIHDRGLRLDDVAYITDEADEDQANSRVYSDDVLLNITGASLGRSSLVPQNFPPANVNQHVCILRPIKSIIYPHFLHLLLLSSIAKSMIVASENGTSREGLNFSQIKEFAFALPSLEEQTTIAQYLDKKTAELDQMTTKIKTAISKLAAYRSSLITQAVTGKIDVRNSTIIKEME